MSSFKFPVIESKKNITQIQQDEDYNFVNKQKKRKPSSTIQPLQIIEELKRKVQQQKKQIQNRNVTIQGLQRNFESLSQIVKNQKMNSAVLKEQLQNLKKNQSGNDKRAAEYHQKLIATTNEFKKYKQQAEKFKKGHLNCGQYIALSQRLKGQISGWEQKYEKLLNKLTDLDNEKLALKEQLAKYKLISEEKARLQNMFARVKNELEKQKQTQVTLHSIITVKDQQLSKLKAILSDHQNKSSGLDDKLDRLNQKNMMLEKQVQRFQDLLNKAIKQNENIKKIAGDKDLINKLKSQEQQSLKRQLAKLNQLLTREKQLTELIQSSLKQSKNNHKNDVTNLNQEIQKSKAQFKQKQGQYIEQIELIKRQIKQLSDFVERLTGQKYQVEVEKDQEISSYGQKVKQLNQELVEISANIGEIENKYGQYLKLIDDNMKKGNVIITNENEFNSILKDSSNLSQELLKYKNQLLQSREQLVKVKEQALKVNENVLLKNKYINSLQSELETKNKQIVELNRKLHKFELQEEQLNKILNGQKNKLSQYEQEKLKSEKDLLSMLQEKEKFKSIIEQKQREIQRQRQQRQRQLKQKQRQKQEYEQKLKQYQMQQQQLKDLMNKQKNMIDELRQKKQQQIQQMIKDKEIQIQKQRNNNKALWQDNQKLKEYEQVIKKQAEKQLEQIQLKKAQQMQRLKKQMQQRLNKLKNSENKDAQSNASELKKILLEKSNQVKIITESFNKLQSQNQLIKKQINKFITDVDFYKNRNKQLEGLIEKVEKNCKEKIAQAQKQSKSYKQVVSVYEKKEKKALQQKADIEQKYKNIENQLMKIKKKYQGQKIEQKLALIKNTIADFELSIKTLLNTFSCNYCVQTVKDCIRLDECGHIYCKKCKAGYEPNCGECKMKSTPKPDKNINESVTKAQYMKILLNTIKDDIHKINL